MTSKPNYRGFAIGRGKSLRRKSAIANYDSESNSGNVSRHSNDLRFISSPLETRKSYNFLRSAPPDASVSKLKEDSRTKRNQGHKSIKKMVSNLCSARLINDGDEYPYMPTNEMDQFPEYGETTNKNLMRQNDNSRNDGHKLDIIIFGATGSLGSYTVLRAVSMLSNFKWGIAGRDQFNLQNVLRNVAAMTNKTLCGIPIFVVDATDKESLLAMANECHVVINCCGPYERTALAVIDCCISVGTNYVDACVEPSFLKVVYTKYDKAAQRQHVYVITSCGFMNFAIDVGINYMDSRFNGDVYTVEAFTQFERLQQSSAPMMSCAAFQNLVGAFASAREIHSIDFEHPCIDHVPRLTYGSPIRSTEGVDGVSIPLPFIVPPAVVQTQQYLHEFEKKPPIQFKNFLSFSSHISAFFALLWCAILFVLAQAPGTRNLVSNFPKFFSLGLCSSTCLQKECLEKYAFTVTLKATGWSDPKHSKTALSKCSCHTPSSYCNQTNRPEKYSNKVMIARMIGLNPFYGYGCVALLASATTILRETQDMPDAGGVYSPGAAFRYTGILQHIANQDKNYRYRLQ